MSDISVFGSAGHICATKDQGKGDVKIKARLEYSSNFQSAISGMEIFPWL